MSFKPVDFSDIKKKLEYKEDPSKKVKVLKEEGLEELLNRIQSDIGMIYRGESPFVHYTPQYPDGKPPPGINAFQRFKEAKTIKTMEMFLEVAEQDFGLKFAKHAKKLLDEQVEERDG